MERERFKGHATIFHSQNMTRETHYHPQTEMPDALLQCLPRREREDDHRAGVRKGEN